ncbi:MAG TPA: FkbM family methyltransferase [Geminicoccaceae bacterium]|nr:FkbM family methyltransferase [Geminicoccus sp.]HMU48862.1 FkbM family methyltransferase [Geminicoccaceae bacterium]
MTEAELRAAAAALGFRLVPERKLKEPLAQLVAALRRQEIDAVLDVGANVGQYGGLLREQGWQGPIVSFEPVREVHAELAARASDDAGWIVVPPMALAASSGEAIFHVSSESDMSSLLPQAAALRRLSPSSAVTGLRSVRTERLDRLPLVVDRPWQRLFLKIDVQGAEPQVLAGAEALWPRIAGVQLELSLIELYEGEKPWRVLLDEVCLRGFSPHLWLPGYFSPHLARQLQIDVVLFREP